MIQTLATLAAFLGLDKIVSTIDRYGAYYGNYTPAQLIGFITEITNYAANKSATELEKITSIIGSTPANLGSSKVNAYYNQAREYLNKLYDKKRNDHNTLMTKVAQVESAVNTFNAQPDSYKKSEMGKNDLEYITGLTNTIKTPAPYESEEDRLKRLMYAGLKADEPKKKSYIEGVISDIGRGFTDTVDAIAGVIDKAVGSE